MSAVSTVFDAFDRAVGEAPPVEQSENGMSPSASSGAAGISSASPSHGSSAPSGGAVVPGDRAGAAGVRLPNVSGGDGDGVSRTIESRVYAEERHVVDINVALPKGTRLRQKGSVQGVTIHTGYGTAKP
ncbi:MAG: hypothetical protein MI724_15285 [Spirochaetales bacterium]|nr:hypothetical protein [Spirochaetales bacterium]